MIGWRRRKRKKRSRWPRQLKTTREGKLLIGLTLGLGFGAINSGNNLLYLILGMLLSMIVVSGILSELALRGVVVRRRFQAALHAGRETFLTLEVTNTKRRLNSFSVEVEEIVGAVEGAVWRPGYALVLKPGETQQVALKLTFPDRGVHRSEGLRIATRYPFGFFRKSRDVPEPRDFVVYPSIHPVLAPGLGAYADGTVESNRRLGRGGEYHGLREHRNDDDPRDIHWKTSARLRRLVSREYERTADRRVWLLVPNAAPKVKARKDRRVWRDVEASISEAASLAAHYTGAGWAVGVQTLDGRVEPGTGPGHLNLVLNHLARVPVHLPESKALASLSVPRSERGERLMVRHPAQRGLPVARGADRVHEVSKQERSRAV